MTREKSCGAVVFTVVGDQIQYLLAESLAGVYGFPKGHMEPGETEIETALREVFEETNIRVTLLDGFRTVTEYTLPDKVDTMKQVVYFVGKYQDQEIIHQKEELTGTCLATYGQALQMLPFAESKRILAEAHTFLLNQMNGESK